MSLQCASCSRTWYVGLSVRILPVYPVYLLAARLVDSGLRNHGCLGLSGWDEANKLRRQRARDMSARRGGPGRLQSRDARSLALSLAALRSSPSENRRFKAGEAAKVETKAELGKRPVQYIAGVGFLRAP